MIGLLVRKSFSPALVNGFYFFSFSNIRLKKKILPSSCMLRAQLILLPPIYQRQLAKCRTQRRFTHDPLCSANDAARDQRPTPLAGIYKRSCTSSYIFSTTFHAPLYQPCANTPRAPTWHAKVGASRARSQFKRCQRIIFYALTCVMRVRMGSMLRYGLICEMRTIEISFVVQLLAASHHSRHARTHTSRILPHFSQSLRRGGSFAMSHLST